MSYEKLIAEELMGMKECPRCRSLTSDPDVDGVHWCDTCNILLVWCERCKKRFAEYGFKVCEECNPEEDVKFRWIGLK